jgi:hypothetical protein
MEIALLVILFFIGSVGGAIQAMKYLERRQQQRGTRQPDKAPYPPPRRR